MKIQVFVMPYCCFVFTVPDTSGASKLEEKFQVAIIGLLACNRYIWKKPQQLCFGNTKICFVNIELSGLNIVTIVITIVFFVNLVPDVKYKYTFIYTGSRNNSMVVRKENTIFLGGFKVRQYYNFSVTS